MVEIGGPKPLSYSSLRTWLSCQEKWRQLRTLKRKRTPGWALVGGSAVHLITERWEMDFSYPDTGAGE